MNIYLRVKKHNVWIVDPVNRETERLDSSMIIRIPGQMRVIPYLENKMKSFQIGTTQSVGGDKTTEQSKSAAPLHTQVASAKTLVSIKGIT